MSTGLKLISLIHTLVASLLGSRTAQMWVCLFIADGGPHQNHEHTEPEKHPSESTATVIKGRQATSIALCFSVSLVWIAETLRLATIFIRVNGVLAK